MSFFKRKEKNLIPEAVPSNGNSNSGGSSSGGGRSSKSKSKQEEDPEGFEKLPSRTYKREQVNYNPAGRTQQPGGYGSYGNYGSAPQPQLQQPGSYPQQQQQPGSYPSQGLSGGNAPAGYGGYNQQTNPDARNDLFKGARAPNATTGASFDRYAAGGSTAGAGGRATGGNDYGEQPEYGEDLSGDGNGARSQDQEQLEEEDEVEAIKQQIRFTKQESLSTTRNAIRTAREAEETATSTLSKLGQQTDRIANTELALDRAKGYNSRAADGAKEIKRLNQSIFKPSFQFNKQSKRDTEDQRILARHLEEKNDREEARQAAYASRQRVEEGFREAEKSSRSRFGFNRGSSSANTNQDGEDLSGTGSSAPKTGRAKWEQGGRYQFEASNSDDELEQELDSNLDEIAGITSRLKILATTAGKEIDAQNKHLDKVSGKVDTLDDKILMNTQYLKRIK